ncbi:MAG: SDR family NAD(P)-dependent oxidoreductase [Mariprofundaceae bacterium]
MRPSALITGASGGFGTEFARQLEAMGFDLLLHGRDRARLQLVLEGLLQPGRHRCLCADLSHSDGQSELIDQLQSEEKLTGLINNAGFGIWGLFAEKQGVAQLDVLTTDLIAPVTITHALLPKLVKQQGFIINVSSLAGETPLPYMSTYAAAKAGLSYWSEALRMELKDRVSVVTLAPGPSPTGFRDVSGMKPGKGRLFSTSAATVVSASLATLSHGGGYCVPGMRHKMLYALQKLVPRRMALSIMARHLRH